jgi:hypothetical protein
MASCQVSYDSGAGVTGHPMEKVVTVDRYFLILAVQYETFKLKNERDMVQLSAFRRDGSQVYMSFYLYNCGRIGFLPFGLRHVGLKGGSVNLCANINR